MWRHTKGWVKTQSWLYMNSFSPLSYFYFVILHWCCFLWGLVGPLYTLWCNFSSAWRNLKKFSRFSREVGLIIPETLRLIFISRKYGWEPQRIPLQEFKVGHAIGECKVKSIRWSYVYMNRCQAKLFIRVYFCVGKDNYLNSYYHCLQL